VTSAPPDDGHIRPGESDAFVARLRELIPPRQTSAFARRSGIPEGSLRDYLGGHDPSRARLVAMADAANVRIEWLAAGRGPRERTASADAIALDDADRLQAAIEAVEEGLAAINRRLPPDKHAQLIIAAYDLIDAMDEDSPGRVINFIRAAA